MRFLFLKLPLHVTRTLFYLTVFLTPVLGVWLASSLVAYINGPTLLAASSGILLFPLLPILWDLRGRKKKQSGILTWGDRITLRTLLLNLVFIKAETDMTLTQLAEQVQQFLNAETAVVAISEDAGNTIVYEAAVGKHAAFIQGKRSPTATSGLCGAVLESGQAVLVCNPQTDVRIRQDLAEQLGITTALAVPVKHDGALVGAIMVLNRLDGEEFTLADEQALGRYAETVAEAIKNSYQA